MANIKYCYYYTISVFCAQWPARVTATPVRMEASVSRSLPPLTRVPALMDSLALLAIKVGVTLSAQEFACIPWDFVVV